MKEKVVGRAEFSSYLYRYYGRKHRIGKAFWIMKKIDRLLVTSFIPPFFVTFMIAIFVLLMQTLWLYIDDIAGKGLGFFMVMELLAYKCVSLIPLALPLAMLISSVMVLGNLAEYYELSSFKSAGVSLLRVMFPLMFFGIASVGLSFFCSNYLIPVANLKFGSRMYDIQRQKPALRLDEGIFNDDFQGYAIHIKKKDADDKTIHDVLIYDHSDATEGRLSQIIAETGEMYATSDGKFFVMNLRDGHQYIETKPGVRGSDRSYPFVRTSFRSWNKVFDLSEFELNRTNEELFKQNRSMMSSRQLREAIDSIGIKILRREKSLANHVSNYFYFMEPDSAFLNLPEDEESAPALPPAKGRSNAQAEDELVDLAKRSDTVPLNLNVQRIPDTARISAPKLVTSDSPRLKVQGEIIAEQKEVQSEAVKRRMRFGGHPIEQQIDKDLKDFDSVVKTFPKYEQARLYNKAKTFARSIQSQAEAAMRALDRMEESRIKHIYDMHTKYSMAVVCFVFLFVGAPMGAIVRKGGFGYPILISIIFFMIFVVLTIFCRKIADSQILPADAAAWVPCAIMFPVGLILTYKAMNDAKVLNLDRLTDFINRIVQRFMPK